MATKPTAAGMRAAVFLARHIIWPAHGDAGTIEKPATPQADPAAHGDLRLERLTTEELEFLARIQRKAMVEAT